MRDVVAQSLFLNYTTTFSKGIITFKEIVADETTPGAVLLAHQALIDRMYPNGTFETILGRKGRRGCV